MERMFRSGRQSRLVLLLMSSAFVVATLCSLVTSLPEAQAQGTKAVPVRNPDAMLGKPRYSEAKVMRYAKSQGSAKYMLRAIPIYYDLAPKVGIAPDVLVAQSMIETGYGNYGGDSRPWNMAGIKKGGNVGDEPRDFERPGTAREGVRMHVNHMAAYTNKDTIGRPHDRYYDAKSAQKGRGYWVRRVSHLGNGVWATDPQYSGKIRKVLNEMSKA